MKLKRDFFKRHDIRIVEDMPNGKDYILFYLKLLVESVDHEGNLRYSDTIPYNENMLASVTNTNIDIVRAAMEVFKQLDLIEILDDATIYMTEINTMLGNETEWAQKKREYRARVGEKKQEAIEDNSRTKKDNVRQEKDKEKEKEIDKDKYNGRFKPPTLEEVKLYCSERSNKIDPEYFLDYYETRGWKLSKGQPMKDWKAAVRTWERNNFEKTKENAKTTFASYPQREEKPDLKGFKISKTKVDPEEIRKRLNNH